MRSFFWWEQDCSEKKLTFSETVEFYPRPASRQNLTVLYSFAVGASGPRKSVYFKNFLVFKVYALEFIVMSLLQFSATATHEIRHV